MPQFERSSARWPLRIRLWGAPRVHGELCSWPHRVRAHGVAALTAAATPLVADMADLSDQSVATLVSTDFFTVPTLTGRVLFVLVLLAHERRRIIHINITEHPTAAWTAQQMVDAFPDNTASRWLLRDRDAIYGDVFWRRVAGMALTRSCPVRPALGKLPIRRG